MPSDHNIDKAANGLRIKPSGRSTQWRKKCKATKQHNVRLIQFTEVRRLSLVDLGLFPLDVVGGSKEPFMHPPFVPFVSAESVSSLLLTKRMKEAEQEYGPREI